MSLAVESMAQAQADDVGDNTVADIDGAFAPAMKSAPRRAETRA